MSIFGMFPCKPCRACHVCDPTSDTVRVNMANMPMITRVQMEIQQGADQAEDWLLVQEREEQALIQDERRQEQALIQEREAEARPLREEVKISCRAEEEHLSLERRRREETVEAVLKEQNFKGATTSKRSMLGSTYPLYCAAEMGNVQLVEMLIQEGADPQQKNSAGKTPLQVAEKNSKNGSHSALLQTLSES
mmetsp:Transcript_81593/g.174861  ORF Transcript_81593/g.174861 Transcript_81593/m.174861 type:complete len:193 (-) Transcript_81593:189-767(-)